jgi:hypothetical protein
VQAYPDGRVVVSYTFHLEISKNKANNKINKINEIRCLYLFFGCRICK